MKTVALTDDDRGNLAAIMHALGVRAKPHTRQAAQAMADRAAKELHLTYKGKATATNRDWILFAAALKPVHAPAKSKTGGKQS